MVPSRSFADSAGIAVAPKLLLKGSAKMLFAKGGLAIVSVAETGIV